MPRYKHIKCRNKPGTICEIFCERCGAADDVDGPVRINEFKRISNKFINRHKNCAATDEKQEKTTK